MKKKALSIDVSEDRLAIRRKKMLEAAAKRKGKLVEDDSSQHVTALPSIPIASPATTKSKRKKREYEPTTVIGLDEYITMSFPFESSLLSEPLPILDEGRKLLLPEDEKRLVALGNKKVGERSVLQSLLAAQGVILMEKELAAMSLERDELTTSKAEVDKENTSLKEEVSELKAIVDRESLRSKTLEFEKRHLAKEVESHLSTLKIKDGELAEILEAKEDAELAASTATEYKLMKEFLEHRGEEWDPNKVIKEYEELLELEKTLAEGLDEETTALEKESVEADEKLGEEKEGERVDEDLAEEEEEDVIF